MSLDHRRLQRALFRLQLDGALAAAAFARAPEALESLGLGERELALLLAADPAAVAADPGGRRRAQVLGNAASEYPLCLARAERLGAAPGLLEGFAAAPELHAALRADGRLPLAFGDYARRAARERRDRPLSALATLEAGLARARRVRGKAPVPGPGALARSPRVHLLTLPAGTFEHAAALRVWLDAGDDAGAPPLAPPLDDGLERALALRAAAPAPHRLAELHVELLAPPVAALLELAGRPVDAARLAEFARAQGAAPEDLAGFVDELVAEGWLSRGAPAA